MTEKERKKWQEMKAMGKKKFIIADGILITGILIGLLLSYVLNMFIFRSHVFLVAMPVMFLMSLYGVYNAKKKWTKMGKEMSAALKEDKKAKYPSKKKEMDDLFFLETPDENEIKEHKEE